MTAELWKFNENTTSQTGYLIIFEDSKEMHLAQITFRNLQSHLAYCYIQMSVLIRHTVCEYLLYIQHFRHEW